MKCSLDSSNFLEEISSLSQYIFFPLFLCIVYSRKPYLSLLSWITALLWQTGFHNSMKTWIMSCWASQDGWVTMKSSDKMWSTGEGNGNPFLYSCHENPMDSIKRQKYMTPEGEHPPRSESSQYITRGEWREITNSSRKNEVTGPKRKWPQLWLCLVVKVKSNCVKNNTASALGMLGLWIKVNWSWSSRRWQGWTSAS